MKKLLLFLLIVFSLNSCMSLKTPYRANFSMISYKPFTEKGFYITESNSVSFGYESIGHISVAVSSGYVKSEEDIEKAQKQTAFIDENFAGEEQDPFYNPGSIFVEATPEDALKLMQKKIIEQGGNGIINLKYSYNLGAIYLSGMAIKKYR